VSVPPKPPAPRSRLGLVTLSLTLLSVGTLAIIGLASGGVPAAAYFAAALAAVGVGLLMGAWVGRARWLIFPGILLSLALAVSSVAPRFGPIEAGGGDIRWSPTSFAEISDRYTHGAGTLELDLSQVDFTGHTKVITVHLNLGDARIMLPSKVDATVNAKVDTGDVRIFEDRWSGVNNAEHTITDNGTDGPGGGRLVINIKVNLGSVEVNR
jgi:hypothetical protein